MKKMARKNKKLLVLKWNVRASERQSLWWEWLTRPFLLKSWLLHQPIYLPRSIIMETTFCRHFSLNAMYFGHYIISKLEPAPSVSRNGQISLLLARSSLWVPGFVSDCLGWGILPQGPWFSLLKFKRQMLHFLPTFLAFSLLGSRIITATCWRLCYLQK